MAAHWPEGEPIVRHTLSLRSRYAETDQMGYVYYGRYLEFFEVARTEMIRGKLGFTYAALEQSGIMLPVVHAEVDYKEPLLYDEEFHVHTFMFRQPAVRLETWYRVTDPSGARLKATGQVTLVFMDAATRKPVRGPAFFLEGLASAGPKP